MDTNIFLLSKKWTKQFPDKLKFIVATDRVNDKHMINGIITRVTPKEYQYCFNGHNSNNIEILIAKKVIFGYEIFLIENSGRKRKLGYLRKHALSNQFIFFQEEHDKILIFFRNVVIDKLLFRTIHVYFDFDDGSVTQKYRNKTRAGLFNLVNRMPKYDPVKNVYTLRFEESTIVPSFKNFQLISPQMPDHITLSMGVVNYGQWALSHSFPWNATQAFSIALSAIISDT